MSKNCYDNKEYEGDEEIASLKEKAAFAGERQRRKRSGAGGRAKKPQKNQIKRQILSN